MEQDNDRLKATVRELADNTEEQLTAQKEDSDRKSAALQLQLQQLAETLQKSQKPGYLTSIGETTLSPEIVRQDDSGRDTVNLSDTTGEQIPPAEIVRQDDSVRGTVDLDKGGSLSSETKAITLPDATISGTGALNSSTSLILPAVLTAHTSDTGAQHDRTQGVAGGTARTHGVADPSARTQGVAISVVGALTGNYQ